LTFDAENRYLLEKLMAIDISVNFCGIKSPNPFWLASGPTTQFSWQLCRAFECGWGGAVSKTFGIRTKNVSPRYLATNLRYKERFSSISNIELISQESQEKNISELYKVKKVYPKNPLFASLMVENTKKTWQEVVKKVQDVGIDGIELNLSCPHGMPERGLGATIGQDPQLTRITCEWVKEVATVPVFAKLTPNVTDITKIAIAAKNGGADGISLINTVSCIAGVDLDTLKPLPTVGGFSTYGGYSGTGIKPIALGMVTKIAKSASLNLPISGMGGISCWQDAVKFILLGATNVQICTAVMEDGFEIIKDLKDGISKWMEEKGYNSIEDFRGKSLEFIKPLSELDTTYRVIAKIDSQKCIRCKRCFLACTNSGNGAVEFSQQEGAKVIREKCTGCGLCAIVCPLSDCITLLPISRVGKR